MERNEGKVHSTYFPGFRPIKAFQNYFLLEEIAFKLVALGGVISIWQLASASYNNSLLLPSPFQTVKALFFALQDISTFKNLFLTLKRLLTGLGIALLIGLTLGFASGYSRVVLKLFDPIVSSVRQVPMMAWVPLTIVWFGLGDGPTHFLIAMVAVFPILLNTIAGVQSVPKNYYHAARSLGARRPSLFLRITLPASLPHIMTGLRIGLGAGWMSVICAEFIATSAGFGFLMVQAQTMMETPLLIGLMLLGGGVGYAMDLIIRRVEKTITKWRFVE